MGTVSIAKTTNGIKPALIQALNLIGGLNRFVAANDRIMLKPNLNGTEGLTDISLFESLIQLLSDLGAKNVIIAESTFGNADMTDMCFLKSGYAELAKKYTIPLINLNRSQYIEKEVARPLVLKKIRIAKEVFEVDKIINVPIMKVHYATGVTLSLKNMKGLLVGEEKRRFHEVGLDKAIVDLNTTVEPALNIVDSIHCMERMGPRGGDRVDLDMILAGEDAAEVDYVGSQIMSYSLEEVKHLKYYIEQHDVDVNEIMIAGESLEKVKRQFKKVQMDTLIPGNVHIHEKDACSACMNALLLSLRFLDKPSRDNVNVYLGSKVDIENVNAEGYKVAFGNCCVYGMGFNAHVKGCPPYPFDLKRVLEEHE
ncbi:MAG: DUF362 domain-containing protein [Candidatus Omnitrophica bacterium]|nr:DUF362 domain-containing protein [Candidatus Omnitrophota bacterium]